MSCLKRDIGKVGITLTSLLIFLVLTAWIAVSASDADEGTSRLALAVMGTMQATPTVDATMTVLSKKQLTLQIMQLQNQLQNQNNWLVNNSTVLIAAFASVIITLFGISQWAINRRDDRRKEITSQDKDLRAQSEERFKTAIAALGDENEGTQIGGAILLRSFLNADDKEIYRRYYSQIFDLATAYLRLPSTSQQVDPDLPLALTPLRQALIMVFQEVFPIVRELEKRGTLPLNARAINLDYAYLWKADLKQVWMPYALVRQAYLRGADLRKATLNNVDFSNSNLSDTNLENAYLRRDNFLMANLSGANLSGANLSNTNLEEAQSLAYTDLRSVKGLSKERLEACKAKGAILDNDTTVSPSQSLN